MKPISLNINHDSLRECAKLVGVELNGLRDPSFFEVMDRFFALASEYSAPLTVFIIGQDLERTENAEAVARWHEQGHEIGNHTYSHRQDLNLLPADQIREEVERAHELIRAATGVAPRGFIAPAWASCPALLEVLRDLDYAYDTSIAPSPLMVVSQAVLRLKSSGARNMIPWLRPDWRANMFGSRQPYFPAEHDYLKETGSRRGPIMLPLPTAHRLAVWHTLSFSMPRRVFRRLVRRAVQASEAFYYLMHPSDLVDPSRDLAGLPPALLNIERMGNSLADKERRLRSVLEELQKHGRFVRMSELAARYR